MKEKSMEELEQIGTGEALYEIGMRYYKGEGLEKDYHKAIEYFEKANNAGNYKGKYENANTLFLLGEIYFYGKDVEIDYKKARDYYEKSLSLRDESDDLYYKLHLLYSGNYGIEKDEEKSKNYLNKVKEDLLKAVVYFILAVRPKEENNLDAIIRYLSVDMDFMRGFEEKLQKVFPNHPSFKYYARVDYLEKDEYSKVAKSIILMLVFGIIEQRYEYIFPEFSNENDVDNYVKELLQK